MGERDGREGVGERWGDPYTVSDSLADGPKLDSFINLIKLNDTLLT